MDDLMVARLHARRGHGLLGARGPGGPDDRRLRARRRAPGGPRCAVGVEALGGLLPGGVVAGWYIRPAPWRAGAPRWRCSHAVPGSRSVRRVLARRVTLRLRPPRIARRGGRRRTPRPQGERRGGGVLERGMGAARGTRRVPAR